VPGSVLVLLRALPHSNHPRAKKYQLSAFTSELSWVDICEKLFLPPTVPVAKTCDSCCDLQRTNIRRDAHFICRLESRNAYSSLLVKLPPWVCEPAPLHVWWDKILEQSHFNVAILFHVLISNERSQVAKFSAIPVNLACLTKNY
jgi:hypothetical protein